MSYSHLPQSFVFYIAKTETEKGTKKGGSVKWEELVKDV